MKSKCRRQHAKVSPGHRLSLSFSTSVNTRAIVHRSNGPFSAKAESGTTPAKSINKLEAKNQLHCASWASTWIWKGSYPQQVREGTRHSSYRLGVTLEPRPYFHMAKTTAQVNSHVCLSNPLRKSSLHLPCLVVIWGPAQAFARSGKEC